MITFQVAISTPPPPPPTPANISDCMLKIYIVEAIGKDVQFKEHATEMKNKLVILCTKRTCM